MVVFSENVLLTAMIAIHFTYVTSNPQFIFTFSKWHGGDRDHLNCYFAMLSSGTEIAIVYPQVPTSMVPSGDCDSGGALRSPSISIRFIRHGGDWCSK